MIYLCILNISIFLIVFGVFIILFTVLLLVLFWSKYRKLKELLTLRDQYYGVIAHDLKSPYIAYFKILDRIRLSLNETNTSYTNEQLDLLENSFYATKNILFNMMKWSQYADKFNDYIPEETNMVDFMHESTEHLIAHANLNDIELLVQVDINEHPIIYKHYVSATLRNLIDNMIKHANCTKIIICATTENKKLIITIVHDGEAMPSEIRNVLMKKSQGGILAKNYGNMGLGLFIIKKSLKKCGGTLEVDSTETKETVTIYFPLQGM
jgi:K+-sensing histidine kinase KdpD